MRQTTSDIAAQAADLATRFLQLSQSVDLYRHEHKDQLSRAARVLLVKQAKQLNDVSDQFTAEAIRVTLLAIQHDLDNIKTVTEQARQAVRTIQKIEKVASIVSASVSLGSAILAGDPTGIGSATKDLVSALSATTDKSA